MSGLNQQFAKLPNAINVFRGFESLTYCQNQNSELDCLILSEYNYTMASKNKRKFRMWDNKTLFQTYDIVSQIRFKIEERCSEEVGPEGLPMSIVPTDMLYDIAACYEAMYMKLLDEELLVAGYPKSTNKTH